MPLSAVNVPISVPLACSSAIVILERRILIGRFVPPPSEPLLPSPEFPSLLEPPPPPPARANAAKPNPPLFLFPQLPVKNKKKIKNRNLLRLLLLPVCLFACLPVCLFACLPVCLFACLPVCLFACLPVCLFV